MAKDAEAHAAEDKEQRESVEARNQLDSLVYNVEKMVKDAGDKVPQTDRAEVENALADAKSTLSGTPNATELNAAKDRLTGVSHKLAEAMYKATAASASATGNGASAGAGAPEEPKKDEGVIDAEYVDVDDKK
jgi:molecular chaperone DnaK